MTVFARPNLLRALGLGPVLVAILWVAGIARFRGYAFSGFEWATLVASALALHIIAKRLQRPRALPPLPAGSKPTTLAFLAAAIVAVLAAIVTGVLELLVAPQVPSDTPWALRTAWHAGCAFVAGFCGFLQRLLAVRRPAS